MPTDRNTLTLGPGLTVSRLAQLAAEMQQLAQDTVLIPIPGSTTGQYMWLGREDARRAGLLGNATVAVVVDGRADIPILHVRPVVRRAEEGERE